MKRKIAIYVFIPALAVLLCCGCAIAKKISPNGNLLSPINFSWNSAKTGIDRYNVLYKTHVAAVAAGLDVSYKGITTVDLEIPADAKSIPLTRNNDFSGAVFNVKNTVKDFYLFESTKKETSISVSKIEIDKGDFEEKGLRAGSFLLVVEDEKSWVKNREGYSYGHIRKDILLVRNGKAQNHTIMPYNNALSLPKCYYYVADKPLVMSNMTLNRSASSTKKTFLCNILGQNDIKLKSVKINTPQNDWTSDAAIRIYDCTNVSFNNVRIDGTYSRKDYSGYGVSLNNIWNFSAVKMYGKGNWGVFGTNNVNTASFSDCDINRFDIHCYGRDVSFKNVNFTDVYNQFAGVYGTISFNKCQFTNFTPIVNGSSYNAYVGYDLVFKDCVFNIVGSKRYLLNLGRIDDVKNERPELADKCWPNISISNMTVNVPKKTNDFMLIYVNKVEGTEVEIDYMKTFAIDGIKFNYEGEVQPVTFYIANHSVSLENAVKCTMERVEIIPDDIRSNKSILGKKRGELIINLFNEGKPLETSVRKSRILSVK